MAGIHEIALGIAAVLRSGAAANPLPVDLCGYAPDHGADFLRHLVDKCADQASHSKRWAPMSGLMCELGD